MVTSSRSGKPLIRRETGGPPNGHRPTPAGNLTEPFLVGDPGTPFPSDLVDNSPHPDGCKPG
jgi:hypothetical protein